MQDALLSGKLTQVFIVFKRDRYTSDPDGQPLVNPTMPNARTDIASVEGDRPDPRPWANRFSGVTQARKEAHRRSVAQLLLSVDPGLIVGGAPIRCGESCGCGASSRPAGTHPVAVESVEVAHAVGLPGASVAEDATDPFPVDLVRGRYPILLTSHVALSVTLDVG